MVGLRLPRITVQATRADQRVACQETHAEHPDGSIWIVGNGQPHTVALTQTVAAAIAHGDLTVLPVEAGPVPAAPTTTTGQVAAAARRKRGSDEPADRE